MKGLFQPSLKMPMIVGLGLAVFQQLTGINTVIYYARRFLSSPELAPPDPRSWPERVNHGDVAFSRAGHLPAGPCWQEAVVISRSCRPDYWPGDLGAAFQFSSWRVSKVMSPLAACDLCRVFRLWTRAIFWLLISEIFPLKVRGPAMSAVTVVNWV